MIMNFKVMNMMIFWHVVQVSPCNERAVLDQLKAYFSKRLSGYLTTVEQDTVVVSWHIEERCQHAHRFMPQIFKSDCSTLHSAIKVCFVVNVRIADRR